MDATADDFRQQKHGKNLLAESIMEIPRALLRGYCARSMVCFGSCLRIIFGGRENDVQYVVSLRSRRPCALPNMHKICEKYNFYSFLGQNIFSHKKK